MTDTCQGIRHFVYLDVCAVLLALLDISTFACRCLAARQREQRCGGHQVAVVDNPYLFVFDEAPVYADGMLAHGNV
jgi:hypothetical protein